MGIPKTVLVATDFSPASGNAIHYACDFAKASHAQLHVIHVRKDPQTASERERTLERLGRVIDPQSEIELDTTKRIVYGDPGVQIVNYARDNEVDIVVMGTHGRTGLAHLAMGSVAESVLRNSPCPVTVLGPHDGENATLSKAIGVIEQIADELLAGKEESHAQLLTSLVSELRIPPTTAGLMLNELEDRKWLTWESNRWNVVEGDELLDTVEPFTIPLSPDNQAVDMIKRARRLRATDIHVDPSGDSEHIVRFRIDGQLREYCRLDRSVAEHLINQSKTLADLDHTDPFQSLEGRVHLPQLNDVEVRLTSVPVLEGQAITLRILDPAKIFQPLSELGLSETALGTVQAMLQQNEGLILVTGPTGSGKTTTVYSMLETMGDASKNVVSIEDPVEFMAPFVRQISVDQEHGMTMTRGLRTLLRMDPDVLFVGEIRDHEAAEITIRAAGSGKYVFSTLHTRDVASVVTSLRNLGISDTTIASNLVGIVNQRLVRKLCEQCKVALVVTDEHRAVFAEAGVTPPAEIFSSVGCEHCNGTGFRGRVGIFEVAKVDTRFRRSIHEGASAEEIANQLRAANIASLSADALSKATAGLIGFDDASRIGWLA